MKKIVTLCTVLALVFAAAITFTALFLKGCGRGGGGDPYEPKNPNNPDNTITTVSAINVSNELEWIAAVAIIQNAGNNKTWTINVTNSFETGQNEWHSYTFGTVGNVTVTINGATGNETISIRASAKDFIFKIYEKQTVVINNINLKGHATNDKSLVDVADKIAAFTMTGTSSISENNSDSAWGAAVVSKGTFIMQDSASIHDNKNSNGGGGVTVTDGTFTMQGSASVYENISAGGGGVKVWGENASFIMKESASVYNNTSRTSSSGGGVLVAEGTFTMRGNASVYNNISEGSMGGGVSVNPSGNGKTVSFIMEGGEIYGNRSTLLATTGRKGGGVAVDGDVGTAVFRIVNGTIYGTGATSPNTVDSGGTGAALYVASGSNTTVQPVTLATSENTVTVVNGVIQP